jgi:imidazolonepropionase-like amidohydrolase
MFVEAGKVDATPRLVYRVRDGGQRPIEAIISATSLSAESLGMQDQVGSISAGMEADIIATDGNPLEDITAVRRVVFVMKGGKVPTPTS